MNDGIIGDVSDTALWVAVYRAQETARDDALFHDRFAGLLAGEKGENIAAAMGRRRLAAWMIVVRTCLIDAYIADLLAQGVDTFVNLGAGLDTRPYRLDLPSSLRWIEVDYSNIIDLKDHRLSGERPRCQLQRVALDLADRAARQNLFDDISARSRKVAVLTEGVIPYLTNDEVASLADDLRARANFEFWIVDFFNPIILRVFRLIQSRGRMKNAPMRFNPGESLLFFQAHGWKERETRYLTVEAEKLGRPFPSKWWIHLLLAFVPKHQRKAARLYAAEADVGSIAQADRLHAHPTRADHNRGIIVGGRAVH